MALPDGRDAPGSVWRCHFLLLVALMYSLLENRLSSPSPLEGNLLAIFRLLPLDQVIYPITALFVLVGTLVGMIASLLSMRKHLRV